MRWAPRAIRHRTSSSVARRARHRRIGTSLATLSARFEHSWEDAMRRCDKLVDVGRRQFLRGAGLAAAGAAAVSVLPAEAKAAAGQAIVAYPSNRLANVKDLKANEPLQVAYPDADAPGVLIKLGAKVDGRRRPRRRHRRLHDDLPAQGLPARLQRRRQDAQLPGPLLPLRLRARRPGDLGPCDAEPPAIHAAGRRQGRHLRRRARRAALRPPVQRALREDRHGLQASHRPSADHPGGCQGAQRHLPLLHRRLRLSRLYLGREHAGRDGARRQHLRRRSRQAAGGRDRRLVLRRRCTTSSSRTGATFTSSSSPTRIAW